MLHNTYKLLLCIYIMLCIRNSTRRAYIFYVTKSVDISIDVDCRYTYQFKDTLMILRLSIPTA